ncbi:hypothetical protein BP6252_07147 [Coleophoma cylindrospora]|uniref:AB hydrolase-1 domain-containing protein n=1 Tax=Coleophoma cylindrospora TaxID=1849047 RepID=A0A3D8RH04_9HELO|nr:hypothetical protein BP6252_07147 [Coleophoma cylindrospora]
MRFSNLLPFAGLSLALSTGVHRQHQQRTSTLPTIVIAPGAWQLVESWDTYLALLTEAGYDYVMVPNLSVGSTTNPRQGLIEDTANMQNTLASLADAGKNIVLFSHSYGGAVASSATEGYDVATRKAAGKTGGVLLTAFMAAFVLPTGSSLLDLLGGVPLEWMLVEGDITICNATQMPEIAFNDLSATEAAYYTNLTTWSSTDAFTEPNTYAPWDNGVPAAYIHTALDNALPIAYQNAMVTYLASTNSSIYTLQSSHVPFISIPDQTLTVWEEIVATAMTYA